MLRFFSSLLEVKSRTTAENRRTSHTISGSSFDRSSKRRVSHQPHLTPFYGLLTSSSCR